MKNGLVQIFLIDMILELGKTYNISVKLKNNFIIETKLKFIKVTSKGYNFLNEETNKCVFKSHFYPIKESSKFYKGPMSFWIYNEIRIKEI